MRPIDVLHLGRERVICCWEADGVLIDPGPESCLETLLTELGETEPRAVLLTHIHFDHAGAAGALVERFPGLPVYVHSRGARHLADPEKLVASATRLYGEEGIQELWGRVVPVPQENLHVLEGGETVLDAYRVAYTPGHASHHVAYLHEDSGWAFTGDVAGVRIPPLDLVSAPTPPPDIDLAAWEASIQILESWSPAALGITHFGFVADPPAQLAGLREALRRQAEWAADSDLEGFTARYREFLRSKVDPGTAAALEQAAPAAHLFAGLDRWHAKQTA
jgi:glyoxylase-like metal-dependent hydrolase (beta-lactamase superfamily II)